MEPYNRNISNINNKQTGKATSISLLKTRASRPQPYTKCFPLKFHDYALPPIASSGNTCNSKASTAALQNNDIPIVVIKPKLVTSTVTKSILKSTTIKSGSSVPNISGILINPIPCDQLNEELIAQKIKVKERREYKPVWRLKTNICPKESPAASISSIRVKSNPSPCDKLKQELIAQKNKIKQCQELKDKVISQPPSTVVPPSEPQRQESSLEALERLSREALAYFTNPSREKQQMESKLAKLQKITNQTTPSQALKQNVQKPVDPVEPQLDADDLTRFKELCPPDDYLPPSSELSDMRVIRPAVGEYLPAADLTTLRCVTNYHLNIQSRPNGYQQYSYYGNYMEPNSMPVPSIWTPRHALMNVAPSISSPGFYQPISRADEDLEESETDSDEERAIY